MNTPQTSEGIFRKNCLLCLGACAGVLLLIPVGFLLFVLFFYFEEDWRGARTWDQAKADIASQGESIDPAKFIPAPVPETENFGALPYFGVASISDPPGSKEIQRLSIEETLKPITDHLPYSQDDAKKPHSLPFLGFWQKGNILDRSAVTAQLRTDLQEQGIPFSENDTPADLLGKLCPTLKNLREENATHPQCRFEKDYSSMKPWKMTYSGTTAFIKITKLLSYDARLSLLSQQPDRALDDCSVVWKIDSGVQKEPLLVSSLVGTGILAIQLTVVNEGLAAHDWNDQQLQRLDMGLGNLDYLAHARMQLCGELAIFGIPLLDYYASNREEWKKASDLMNSLVGDDDTSWNSRSLAATYNILPEGWFELAKADMARRRIKCLQGIKPSDHLVDPAIEKEEAAISSDPAVQWMEFLTAPNDLVTNAAKSIAYEQVQLDEARIACRLERYRLAHQKYPTTLEDMSRDYGPLPHDLMNGQAYHYQINADQTYLLYSVGWNQKDDNGDAGNVRKWDSPDWIWTNYPNRK